MAVDSHVPRVTVTLVPSVCLADTRAMSATHLRLDQPDPTGRRVRGNGDRTAVHHWYGGKNNNKQLVPANAWDHGEL